MVAWQKVSIEGLEIWARPKSLTRRFLDRIYFLISTLQNQWMLYVRRLPEPRQTNKLYWWLLLPDGRVTGDEIDIPNLKPGEECTFEIGGRLISSVGNTALYIAPIEWMPVKQGKMVVTPQAYHHTIYEFRSASEEDIFIGVLAGIIAGLFLLFIKLGLHMNL